MGDEQKEGTIKAILLGESMVGKTCLIRRIISDQFGDIKSTVGPSFNSVDIEINGNTLKLTLWDTAGQEKFRSLNKIYYKGAEIELLVYSVIDRKSFEELKNYWYQEVKASCKLNSGIIIFNLCSDCYCCK